MVPRVSTLKIAVAGVGFIGQVHVKAAKAAGAEVVAVSGGNPERTAATAERLGVSRTASSEELAMDPSIDVLHICTPNNSHASLAKLALENGKHVICEKPLATSAADAAEITALASANSLVAAVPFVYRFHPMVREARARVANGETGPLRLIHGSYQQDWLASPDDYSWRVDKSVGGASQAFADIGSHWCDLIEFVTGHRIVRLSAKTLTTVPERAVHDGAAFSSGAASKRKAVDGDDAITMMFQTDKGASGTVLISQVSWGRKNRLWFELDGANQSVVFDQEEAEKLWLGHRASSTTLVRDPASLDPEAARYATLPAGHAQGYDGCFDAFVADVYSAIAAGTAPSGLPMFADGARAAVITETVLASAASETWKEVPQ